MDPRLERLLRRAAEDPSVLPLGGGLPASSLFPRAALARAFVEAVHGPSPAALQYGWPEGSPALREWVAARLGARGARVDADDVLVTNGAQQAIALALQLTTRPGSRVATDAETYSGALDLFRARRRVAVAAPAGWRKARVAYVMPEVANPRGGAMAPEDRARLLSSGATVIEDDAYADLRFDGPPGRPLLAEEPARVYHVGTFSKSLCPGLRVGWLVVPRARRDAARRLRQATDLQPNSLSQAVVEAYLRHADFDARLDRLRRFYARRARRLLAALARELPSWRVARPAGGFTVWARPDRHVPERVLLRRAVARGVTVDPGSSFRPDAAARPLALRLSFSSATREEDLDAAVRRLARCWSAL